jgi:hypothetical protein
VLLVNSGDDWYVCGIVVNGVDRRMMLLLQKMWREVANEWDEG